MCSLVAVKPQWKIVYQSKHSFHDVCNSPQPLNWYLLNSTYLATAHFSITIDHIISRQPSFHGFLIRINAILKTVKDWLQFSRLTLSQEKPKTFNQIWTQSFQLQLYDPGASPNWPDIYNCKQWRQTSTLSSQPLFCSICLFFRGDLKTAAIQFWHFYFMTWHHIVHKCMYCAYSSVFKG